MRLNISITIANLLMLAFVACGRVGYPFTPEELGAAAVGNLVVTPRDNAVEFAWEAPRDDVRGEPLKSLDEYQVLRKTIVNQADYLDPEVEFELLAALPDKSWAGRKQLEEEALEKGLPRRRVKVPAELTQYSFVDDKVQTGQRYVYQVVPVNQGGVLGQAEYFIDLTFNGPTTKVSMTNALNEELALPEEEIE